MRSLFLIILFVPGILFSQSLDTVTWNQKADTGHDVSYLNDFEKEVLRELNKARTNPSLYARLYIEPMIKDFNGKINMQTKVETREGISPLKECIKQLKGTIAIGLLEPNEKLYRTALEHTSEQSKTRQVGHTSPDGRSFVDRVKKLKFPTAAECISYGEDTPRGVVTALLIDDGVANRGHRKTILSKQLNAAGLAAAGHLVFRHMCTIDFAGIPTQR